MSAVFPLTGTTPPALTTTSVRVLTSLRDHGEQTLSELASATGLSRPTVRAALVELERYGLAIEDPVDTRGRIGRPAAQYLFQPRAGAVLGLDIGAHRIRASLGDLNGDEIARSELAVAPSLTGRRRWQAVARLLGSLMRDAGMPRDRILAASVGTVGIIDDHGKVVLSSVIRDWTGYDLRGAMTELLGCPVRVESDAALAALGERWRGAARGVDNVVFVHVGWRTGSAVLIGGEIYRGSHGASGEIGALPAIGWATARRTLVSAAVDEAEGRDAVADVVLRARADDSRAIRKIERFAEHIVPGIAALVLVLDPEMVVIGGGLSGVGRLLLDPIAKGVRQLALTAPAVEISTLGADAAVVGAVRHALDYVESEVLSIRGKS